MAHHYRTGRTDEHFDIAGRSNAEHSFPAVMTISHRGDRFRNNNKAIPSPDKANRHPESGEECFHSPARSDKGEASPQNPDFYFRQHFQPTTA